jgi:hypothetical protein
VFNLTADLRLGESEDAYKQVQDDGENNGSFGHEAIAGAAAFGAFKMYEDKQRKDGICSRIFLVPTISDVLLVLTIYRWSC